MGITSDACWVLLIKTLLIKNNKKREAAPKNEAGGDEKRVYFYLALSRFNHSQQLTASYTLLNMSFAAKLFHLASQESVGGR